VDIREWTCGCVQRDGVFTLCEIGLENLSRVMRGRDGAAPRHHVGEPCDKLYPYPARGW
jgi:hypothetical protein